MLDRTEIKKRLTGVSPELCIAFYTRSALRILPLLAMEGGEHPFGYWPSRERAKHLLAILSGLRVCVAVSSNLKIDAAINDADAAFNTASNACSYAEAEANVAANAVAHVAMYVTWAELDNLLNT